ncbi:hypothetical protein G0U57_010328, partial [Chelydra serpentina]
PQIKRGATSYLGLVRTQQIYGKVEVPHGFPGYYYPFPGDWYAALDMKDAYFHIAVYPPHRRFLRFVVDQRHFQFAVLPFGLSTAPRVFMKCMAVVAAALRRWRIQVFPYLDDWLIRGNSSSQVQSQVQTAKSMFNQLDLLLNVEKSTLEPTQRLDFIGAVLDSTLVRAFLPEAKRSCNHHTRPSELPNLDSSKLPQPAWSHGVLHIRDYTRQIMPPSVPGMALVSISSTQRQHGCRIEGAIAGPSLPRLVAGSQEGAGRGAISCTTALPSRHHRCVIPRLVGPPERSSDTGPVVGSGISPPHQPQGAAGSAPCLPSLFQAPSGSLCRSPHGQHNGHVLYQQARGGTFVPTLARSHTVVGVLHSPLHPPGGLLSPRGSEHLGGPPQQILPGTRVIHSPGCYPLCLPEVGISPHRPVRDSRELEVPRVLLAPGTLPRLPDGRFSPALDRPPVLCLSTFAAGPQGPAQVTQGQGPPNPDRPGVAQAVLVHHSLLELSVTAPITLPLWPDLITQEHSRLRHPDLQSLHLTACLLHG